MLNSRVLASPLERNNRQVVQRIDDRGDDSRKLASPRDRKEITGFEWHFMESTSKNNIFSPLRKKRTSGEGTTWRRSTRRWIDKKRFCCSACLQTKPDSRDT